MKALTYTVFALTLLLNSGCTSPFEDVNETLCRIYEPEQYKLKGGHCVLDNYYMGWKAGFAPKTEDGDDRVRIIVHPKEFRILTDGYAKDDSTVFFLRRVVHGADAKTFSVIEKGYARDWKKVYHGNTPVEGACCDSFKVLDYGYSTDGFEIFYLSKPIHVTNVSNFKILDGGLNRVWSTDGNYCYFNDSKITSLDIKSFESVNDADRVYKDKNWVYVGDHKLNYNAKGKTIIDTVDAATFENFAPEQYKDKFGRIIIYQGRK